MSTRADKPKEYFAKLLNTPEDKIDYSQIPATTRADWENAEVLFPVTADEFREIRKFIEARRERSHPTHHPAC